MAQKSLELIEAMHAIAESAQPITGRGIGYKLFTAGMIPSMSVKDMQRVYRLLKEARERGLVPWEWIVDETRELESVPSTLGTRQSSSELQADPIAGTTGSNSRRVSKCGVRRAPFEACSLQFSMSTASDSG
jgi:hypothetical protein